MADIPIQVKRVARFMQSGRERIENIALILIPLFSQAIDLEVPLHIPGLASTDSYYNLR